MASISDLPGDAGARLSEDAFLGGRLVLRQPRRGHRAGLEAVLIAAAAPLRAGETLLDVGAGVGVAASCALARCPGASAVLVEADGALAALAEANLAANALSARARVVACDVLPVGAAGRAGLAGTVDHAIANPPFHDPRRARVSGDKAAAHAAGPQALDAWVRFAAAALRPRGTLTMVHRADALPAVLDAFRRRFGALRLVPVRPRAAMPATRILVQGVKGSRAAPALLPGLVLHPPEGHGFTARLEAVLRYGAALPLAPDAAAPHLVSVSDQPAR